MKRVIVTWGNNFICRHFVRELIDRNALIDQAFRAVAPPQPSLELSRFKGAVIKRGSIAFRRRATMKLETLRLVS